jgi:hypothetical protein
VSVRKNKYCNYELYISLIIRFIKYIVRLNLSSVVFYVVAWTSFWLGECVVHLFPGPYVREARPVNYIYRVKICRTPLIKLRIMVVVSLGWVKGVWCEWLLELPKLNHDYAIVTLVGNQNAIDERDDFHLVSAQSCVRQSSSAWRDVLISSQQCPATMCPISFTQDMSLK